jgi:hypothetical protein
MIYRTLIRATIWLVRNRNTVNVASLAAGLVLSALGVFADSEEMNGFL